MTTGIPINPNYFTGLKYNSAFYNTSGGLTLAEALTKFLAFPIAQGNETMASVIVSDTLTASKNIIMNGTTNVNYIQFPDTTKQYTAVDPTDYATLNGSNIFLSENSPIQPYQQTITGNNLSGNTNAPLVVKNIDTNEYFGWYIDPSSNFDTTLYSNQTSGGLTIRNIDGNSFSVAPSAPNNTALFSNPISCGTFPLTAGNITGTQLTLSSSGNTSVLSTSATGLNVADPIVATGNITSTGFVINDSVNNSYILYTNTSPSDYGFVIANTTGNNGSLTLSNNSTINTTLTSTTTGLSCNDSIIVPTQTYPLTSSDQVATISYVNTAISSQGGGDASLSANQTFTGLNTFSQNITLPTQSYVPSNTYGDLAATQSFVQQTIYEGILNTSITVPLSNVTGWETQYQPTSFTFNQIFNQGTQTNSYYMNAYSAVTFSTLAINFTMTFPTALYPTGTTLNPFIQGTGFNFYSSQTGQSFNLNVTVVDQFTISVSSGGTTPNSGTGKLTGQILLSFT